ncbi:sce7726 family protein [Aeromonas hydrophila]|uniref:sce7726 family protein n=1 Tax=Aeromonas hydrophila TaxID=644 RepID=UPI003F78CDBA
MKNSERYLITKLFSKHSLQILAEEGGNHKIKELIHHHLSERSCTILEAFEFLYNKLFMEYRNEYVYKNAIAEKIVKGRHKMANISYFTEFRVRKTIADCVIVNGYSTAYEIKTEFDSFYRLQDQLESYKKVFEKVNIVVPESKVKKLKQEVSESIGIVVLTDRYTFESVQESDIHTECLQHDVVFDCLNKNEIFDIVLENFGSLPQAQPAFLRNKCKEMFNSLPKEIVSSEFKKALKQRRTLAKHKNELLKSPNSLLSLMCASNFSEKNYKIIFHNLEQQLS